MSGITKINNKILHLLIIRYFCLPLKHNFFFVFFNYTHELFYCSTLNFNNASTLINFKFLDYKHKFILKNKRRMSLLRF
jgi:hypothetical protein